MGNGQVTFIETKNGQNRTLLMSDRVKKILKELGPKVDGPVFTYKGNPINDIKTSFRNACNKAGLKNVRFHDLRHTFASKLVQGGTPLYNVKEMTGHATLQMVQRYAHLSPDYQTKAIKLLNNLNGHNLGTVE
jgi:integrase